MRGKAGQGTAWQAGSGAIGFGGVRSGEVWQAGNGKAGFGEVWCGAAWQARQGPVRSGEARRGTEIKERRSTDDLQMETKLAHQD